MILPILVSIAGLNLRFQTSPSHSGDAPSPLLGLNPIQHNPNDIAATIASFGFRGASIANHPQANRNIVEILRHRCGNIPADGSLIWVVIVTTKVAILYGAIGPNTTHFAKVHSF